MCPCVSVRACVRVCASVCLCDSYVTLGSIISEASAAGEIARARDRRAYSVVADAGAGDGDGDADDGEEVWYYADESGSPQVRVNTGRHWVRACVRRGSRRARSLCRG